MLPWALSDSQRAPPGIGSAEIKETSDIRTNKLAKIAVATSFIEASLASVGVDLLDVRSKEKLTRARSSEFTED